MKPRDASFFQPGRDSAPGAQSELAQTSANYSEPHESPASARNPLFRPVAFAIAALILLAFVGGIGLASFSFNSHPVRTAAAAPAPEIIYLPPSTAAIESAPAAERPRAQGEASVALTNERFAMELAARGTIHVARAATAQFDDVAVEPGLRSENDGPTTSAVEGETRFAVADATPFAPPPPPPAVQHSYDALSLPVVPEPSATILIATSLAALAAARRFVRRR